MELRRVLDQSTETITASDGSGPWRVRLTYGLVDDRPQVIGVEMWGADPQLVADERAGRATRSSTRPNVSRRTVTPAHSQATNGATLSGGS